MTMRTVLVMIHRQILVDNNCMDLNLGLRIVWPIVAFLKVCLCMSMQKKKKTTKDFAQ